MPDFKWSPEAIDAALARYDWPAPEDHAPVGGAPAARLRRIAGALDAAVRAQPVIALPPCHNCGGHGEGRTRESADLPWEPCWTCKGSGVERMVPVSGIVDWLRGCSEFGAL